MKGIVFFLIVILMLVQPALSGFLRCSGQDHDQYDPPLYQGRIFIPESYPDANHPYFMSNRWIEGSITLEGVLFTGVLQQFNITEEGMALSLPLGNRSVFIHPHPSRIDEFKMADHRFIKIDEAHREFGDCRPGFYELLYENRLRLLVKHTKIAAQGSVGQEQFDYRMSRYIQRNGGCFLVRNRRELLIALGDHQEEIKVFLKESGIFVRGASDQDIIRVLIHYSEISREDDE